MSNQPNGTKSLSLIQKIGYGVGDLGSNYCWTFVASFIMLYCTNILGVSAAMVGTVMMFSKVLDGFTDVIMGYIIDNTKSRMGKARFWYFVSTFPTAVCVYLIFNVPASFTENTKYIYIFLVYTLMGTVFYTMNNIAYSALTALVTKNPKDRVQMGSYRYVFAMASVLLISSFTSGLVEHFGGGQEGWRSVSLIYAIVCFVFLMIPVFAVKELPEEELKDEAEQKKEKTSIWKDLAYLVKNKYFILILVFYLANYFCAGIQQGMGIYFATYKWNNATLLGTLNMANMIPSMILLPFVPRLTNKLGIRKASMWGQVLAVFGGVVVVFAGLVNGLPILLLGMIIKAVGSAPMTGARNALIAEADDYSYLKFGRRLTGTIYSCSSVGIKVGTGIGTAVCGFLLEAGGFDGLAEVQTAGAISVINWGYLGSIILLPLVSAIILYFMDVEKVNKKLRAEK